MWSGFLNNEKGFTGLEASIVMIAFVVLAAVFSYVMLGSGFYATQESQKVVHNGVTQASSSLALSGDVIVGSNASDTASTVTFYVTNTAGGTPLDLNKTIITYTDNGNFITFPYDAANGSWTYTPVIKNDNATNLVESGDVYKIILDLASHDIVNLVNNVFITNRGDDTIRVVNRLDHTQIATIPGTAYETGAGITPSGSTLYVTKGDIVGGLSFINTSNFTNYRSITLPKWSSYVVFSPDNSNAWISCSGANCVSVINVTNETAFLNINTGNYPRHLAISPDGRTISTPNGGDGTVSLINTTNYTNYATINVSGNPMTALFTADSKTLYVKDASFPGNISVINVSMCTVTSTINNIPGTGLAISSDGTKLYTYKDPYLYVLNTTTQNLTNTVVSGGGSAENVEISPDGNEIYLPTNSNNVYVFDTKTENFTNTLSGFNWCLDAVFYPSSTPVNVAGTSSTVLPVSNEKFTLEVKPPEGATLAFTRTLPPSISAGEYCPVY